MDKMDLSKELWFLANIITGFSVAQSIGVSIGFAKDLADLQLQTLKVKAAITGVAILFCAGYCCAVWRCCFWAKYLHSAKESLLVWDEVTYGRIACIIVFTGVMVFALFAPNIFPSRKSSSSLPDKAVPTLPK
jgi:hypothetical protein